MTLNKWCRAHVAASFARPTCIMTQHRGTNGEVSRGTRTDDEFCGQWRKRRGAQVFGPGCVACGQDKVVEQCSSFARFEAVILGMRVFKGLDHRHHHGS